MKKSLALASAFTVALVLMGCGSSSNTTTNTEPAPVPVQSDASNGEPDYEAINKGTAEMTEIGNELGLVSTLAAEACLQQDQTKIAQLGDQVTKLLMRAEAVPDGGLPNMVIARTKAQLALRKASEGLTTCDPVTWMAVVTDMKATGQALAEVSREFEN